MIGLALSSSYISPIHCLYAVIEYEETGEGIQILPNNVIHLTEWGTPLGSDSFINVDEKKGAIHILWLSLIENKIYDFSVKLDRLNLKEDTKVLVGCSTKGHVCIWKLNNNVSRIVFYSSGTCVDQLIRDKIGNDQIIVVSEEEKYTIDELYYYFNSEFRSLSQGVFFPESVEEYMKKYIYRYVVNFNNSSYSEFNDQNSIELENMRFDYIEEALFDGTHDKLHDGGLMKYHEAGKPKKLALKWHIKKSDYSAYFWFEEEEICTIFNKFYGQHPDTKTDFIIHIDPIKKKYELSLYRYGLKEPVIIPESAYQLIVFKSGFENYRSDNYNQPTGAWIW